MKRFFAISIFLHAALLGLLFSWEIPRAGRVFPADVIEVSILEEGGERAGAKINGNASQMGSLWKERDSNLGRSKREIGAFKKEGKAEPKRPAKQEKEETKSRGEETRETIKAEKKKEQTQSNRLEASEKVAPQTQEEKETAQADLRKAMTTATEEPRPPHLVSQLNEKKGGLPASLKGAEWKGPTFSLSMSSEAAGIVVPLGAEHGGGSPFLGNTVASKMSPGLSPGPSPGSQGDGIVSLILGKIEAAKRYPRAARKMGIEGTATVRFKLRPNGQLEKIELLESSGSKILDDASLETVREAAPLPYKEGWLKVGIAFKIL